MINIGNKIREGKMKNTIIVAALVIIAISAFADVDLEYYGPTGFTANCRSDEPILKPTMNNDFTVISLPDGALDGEIGGPLLPAYRYLIEIPMDGVAEVTVLSHSSSKIELPVRPFPRQAPRFKNRPEPELLLDRDLYENPIAKPIAEIEQLGVMRGRNLGILIVRPLTYDPAREILEFRQDIRLCVEYNRPLSPLPERLHSSWADGLLSTTFLVPTEIPRVFGLPPQYLILTDNYFAPHISELIQLKEQQGYIVTLASIDTISADTSGIKDFVEAAYDDWLVPPDYLLIIGDEDRIPTFEINEGWDHYPTDQYYVMVDGPDYFPDIACGRMSVSDLTELDAIIDKTIAYAHFDFTETDWLRHFVLPACGADGDYELCMGTQRYVSSSHLPPSDYDVDTIFAYYGGTSAQLIAAINEGAAVVDYSGHGEEIGWSNPEVDVTDIPSLTNDGKFGLVISNACLTNKFDHDTPCFGETWIRQTNKGAVAFIAGSASTYWDEDDWWERAVFDAVFDSGYYAAASFMYRGCLEVELRGSSGAEYYFDIYHCLGDPSLSFYWGESDEFAVDVPEIVPLGVSSIDIVAPESTIVSLWSRLGPRGSAYSIGGTAHIEIDPVPVVTDTFSIYCWRPNFWQPIWDNFPIAPLVAFSIIPESLIVAVPGSIEVYMGDTSGSPMPDATILVEGIVFAETLTTGADGFANLSFTPIYAETLKITGYNALDELAFMEFIPVVGGVPLMPVGLEVGSPIVHISDSLATGVPGQIGFESSVYPMLWCLQGSGLDTCMTASDSVAIEITPLTPGNITLTTTADGYALGRTMIRAEDCLGPFDGTVTDLTGASHPESVELTLYPAGADTSLVDYTAIVTSDASGDFTSSAPVKCGFYDIYTQGFGWSDSLITDHIHHADGGYDFRIDRSNDCSLNVMIMDSTGFPMLAEIALIRDGNRLSAYERGSELSIGGLPLYDYELIVSARGFAIHREILSLTDDLHVNVYLEEVHANVLLLSISDDLAADFIESDLLSLGLTVIRKNYLPQLDSLWDYEFAIYSAGGGSDGEIGSAETGFKLLEYRYAGVKLMIEGGEVGYTFYDLDEDELTDSLIMISSWNGDDPWTNNLILNPEPEGAYELAYNPATLPSIITPRDVGHWDYEYFDLITSGASDVLYAVGTTERASVTYHPDSSCHGVHRIAHMFFKYNDALTTPIANKKVLTNIVEWLRPPDFQHGILLAQAWVPGGESGDIDVVGGGDTSTTAADGRLRLQMTPGSHDLAFSASHIRDSIVTDIELDPGEIRTGDIFVLIATGIDEAPKPDEFALTGVFPNPFNGRIAFEIQAPTMATVGLSIFDLNGRRVHEEIREIEGRVKLVWDTSKSGGLPSGLYFYRIELPDGVRDGKVLLVK